MFRLTKDFDSSSKIFCATHFIVNIYFVRSSEAFVEQKGFVCLLHGFKLISAFVRYSLESFLQNGLFRNADN